MGVNICEYGCGQEAKYQMTNDKWCCSKYYNSCPEIKRKNSETNKIKQLGKNNGFYGKHHSIQTRKKLSKSHSGKSIHTIEWKKELMEKMKGENNPFFGKNHSSKVKKIISNLKKLTIEQIKIKYPFFSKVEEMRYNPNKPNEKEIQVHCKNHNCPNSKERNGWFTPIRSQFFERKRQLESKNGQGGCYFYCSQECKDVCPLFNLYSDPYIIKTGKLYTEQEYQTFRQCVLKRDNYICQYCGEKSTDVHHERPQKLEPFFALDPDFAWSCCEECHYKYGHKDECSTGQLANKICL